MIRSTLTLAAALGAGLLLSGCTQSPVDDASAAETACRKEIARNSTVRPNIGIGIGPNGPRVRTTMTVPSGALDPRPYDQRLADCISRKVAGQPPAPRVAATVGTTL